LFGRVPIRDVRSVDAVTAFLATLGEAAVVIFDVDNTLAPQDASLEEFGVLVNTAIDRFEASANVERVIVLTNGRQRGVPRMISRGNKPWTSRRRLLLRGPQHPIVVVGN